jgi:hypothetical protein
MELSTTREATRFLGWLGASCCVEINELLFFHQRNLYIVPTTHFIVLYTTCFGYLVADIYIVIYITKYNYRIYIVIQ